jgi:hypothetical protein
MSTIKDSMNFTEYKNILITTDLEPDDLIALYILAKHIVAKNITAQLIFLVGENNAIMKYHRMCEYIKLMGFPDKSKVLRGYDSKRKFAYDGYDVFNENKIAEINAEDSIDDAADTIDVLEYLQLLIANATTTNDLLIISMKPARELYNLYVFAELKAADDQRQHKMRTPNIFRNITICGYMGFNCRVLIEQNKCNNDYAHVQTVVADFWNSFHKVIYYESWTTLGENNTITSDDFSFDIFPEFIRSNIYYWNKHSLETSKNQKVLASVRANMKQFVHADPSLILYMCNPDSQKQRPDTLFCTKLSFNEKNQSIFSPDNNSNIFAVVVPDAQKPEYRRTQIAAMQTYFTK